MLVVVSSILRICSVLICIIVFVAAVPREESLKLYLIIWYNLQDAEDVYKSKSLRVCESKKKHLHAQMHSGPQALTTYAVLYISLEQSEWLSDKQTYYWALIDQSTGRPAHSKDSRSYFIALLISPNSLYFISSSAFSFSLSLSLRSHSFISFCTALKVNRFLLPLTVVDHFHRKWFDVLFKQSLSRGLRQVIPPWSQTSFLTFWARTPGLSHLFVERVY